MDPKTQAFLDGIRKNHEERCRMFLTGKKIEKEFLWMSVGYFYAGAGQWNRPFTDDEWQKLLKATDRKENSNG